jgi:hypothetical protein
MVEILMQMNPLTRRIQSHIVSILVLKQYMQNNGYPSEIAGIILEIRHELIEWTLICEPSCVYFMVENDLFAWGQNGQASLRHIEFFRSPHRILVDKDREFILSDMERIKYEYACKSTLRDNNIVLSGHDYDYNVVSLYEMSVPNVKRIFWGNHTAFVLTHSGDVYSCGLNNYGQLGHEACMSLKSLAKIKFSDELIKIVKVACGMLHTLFLTEIGTVYGCGINDLGQLGIGDGRKVHHVERPVGVALSHVIDICCGDNYSVAITSDGNIHAWGWNYNGQLGLGDSQRRVIPQLITFTKF